MRLALCTLLMCMWVLTAHAQQSADGLCKQLSQYVPIEGAEFNPSVADVPADIMQLQDPVYGSISIPVEIDLAEYLNRPDLDLVPGLNLQADVSSIIINQDGSVFYNGQEISQDVKRLCNFPSGENVEAKKLQDKLRKPVVAKSKKVVPKAKPRIEKPVPKKSSVRVFNGPKTVIANEPEIKPEKPKPAPKKAIDVEVLKAQDNTDEKVVAKDDDDDDSIIEGQYP